LQKVLVELWREQEPSGLHLIHTSVLAVGNDGITVGDGQGDDITVYLPPGDWPLQIYTDAPNPSEVGRVVFVIKNP
jgi:hypothetical protein